MKEKIIKCIRENAKGRSVKELQEIIKIKLEEEISTSHIKYLKNKYNIKSGPIATFKKGHIPLRHVPIGSERIQNGHVLVKVAEPSIWKTKQRVVYEREHGEIPEGYIVIFADRNKRNYAPENLILLSKSEALIMNDNHLYKEEAELTKSGVLVAKIIDRTRKLERKNDGRD